MQSDINPLTVSIRELGAGGIWRCGDEDPRPAALLMCDLRRGRSPERACRACEVAEIDACTRRSSGSRNDNLDVEYTRHRRRRDVSRALRRFQRRLESRISPTASGPEILGQATSGAGRYRGFESIVAA